MDSWIAEINEKYLDFCKSDAEIFSFISTIEKEYSFLKNKMIIINSPLAFCHNDLQENNILKNAESGEIYFIDFEYSNYNYRGFDFGNHFCEYAIDYLDPNENGFVINLENYPIRDQQHQFFSHYLRAINNRPPVDDEVDKLILESRLFSLFSHMYWGLWGIVQSQMSKVKFNYQQYAKERFMCYSKQKDSFFGSTILF